MTLGIPLRNLLLTLLLVAALLSGCGSSSEDENIPYTVEVWNQHSIVFGNNSTAKMAGYNGYGQLGDGSRETRYEAVDVQLAGVAGFSAGATHTLAFTRAGSVFAWGFNNYGQLGNSNIDTSRDSRTDDYSATPVQVDTLTGVTSVAAGGFHSLAVSGGRVYSWGDNTQQQLGRDTAAETINNGPGEVPGLTNVIQVAAGGRHSLALTSDKRVLAWGDNRVQQVKPSSDTTSVAPVEVLFNGLAPGAVPVEIAAGGSFNLARMSDGTVYAWGHNQYGQVGSASNGAQDAAVGVPQKVTFEAGLEATGIAAGLGHAVAVMSNGTVWAWGFNERGQLGNNPVIDYSKGAPTPNSSKPVQVLKEDTSQPGSVTPMTGVEKVQAFGNSSLATLRNAEGRIEIWGWGDSGFGQLGDGRSENGMGMRLVPVKMRGI